MTLDIVISYCDNNSDIGSLGEALECEIFTHLKDWSIISEYKAEVDMKINLLKEYLIGNKGIWKTAFLSSEKLKPFTIRGTSQKDNTIFETQSILKLTAYKRADGSCYITAFDVFGTTTILT